MTRVSLLLVRILLPAAIAAAGVVLIVTAAGENEQGAGVALIGCAVVVLMLNLFLRLGFHAAGPRARGGGARALRPHRPAGRTRTERPRASRRSVAAMTGP